MGPGPGDDDPVTQTSKYYPSAAGMSFVLPELGGLEISLQAVTYQSEREEGREAEQDGRWTRHPVPEGGTLAIGLLAGESWHPVLGGRANVIVRTRPSKGGHAVTVAVVNAVQASDLPRSKKSGELSRDAVARTSLFEVALDVCPTSHPIGYASSDAGLLDSEDRELAFTYREFPAFAVGHGAAVDWQEIDGRLRISLSFVPRRLVPSVSFDTERTRALGSALDLGTLRDSMDLAGLLGPLASGYSAWIEGQVEGLRGEALSDNLREVGGQVIARQRRAWRGSRMASPSLVATRWPPRRFPPRQRHHVPADAAPRASREGAHGPRWRAFQLAFALMVIPSLVDPEHADREIVDLLWFPNRRRKDRGVPVPDGVRDGASPAGRRRTDDGTSSCRGTPCAC